MTEIGAPVPSSNPDCPCELHRQTRPGEDAMLVKALIPGTGHATVVLYPACPLHGAVVRALRARPLEAVVAPRPEYPQVNSGPLCRAEESGYLDSTDVFCPFASGGECTSGCPSNRERACLLAD